MFGNKILCPSLTKILSLSVLLLLTNNKNDKDEADELLH